MRLYTWRLTLSSGQFFNRQRKYVCSSVPKSENFKFYLTRKAGKDFHKLNLEIQKDPHNGLEVSGWHNVNQ
jgi:hypothetical protein